MKNRFVWNVQPYAILCFLSMILLPVAQADKPVMPFTASELPVMATTPNLVYGASGPQVLLDAATFESIPGPIYLDKALEEKLSAQPDAKAGSTLFVNQIALEYSPIVKLASQTITENKDMNLDGIKEVAGKGLLKCQDAGYVCDAVIQLENDSLNMVLKPLTLESVQVEGESVSQKKALNHLLRWIPVDQPFKLHAVQRQLRLIQSNPDLPMKAELVVPPYSHQIQLKIVSAQIKNPNHVTLSWNNLDQPIFGRHLGTLTEVNNNLTGHGDSLMVSVVQGYRSTAGFTHYEYPVTPALRPFVEASIGRIAPFKESYSAGEVSGMAMRVTSGLKYVLLDRPNARLSADLDFDFKQAYSYPRGSSWMLEREAVRTIRGGFNYDQKWKTASFSTRHEFAGGIPVLKGSLSDDPRLSWYKGGSQYFRYTGYALLTKQMPKESTLTLNTQWQFTPNGLTNFDVGGVGGAFYGRGYREVFNFVDSYSITSVQWQVPAHFIPKRVKLPFSDKSVRDSFSFLTFVDYAYGLIARPSAGVDPNKNLLSTGVGVRSQITNRVSGRLDVGFPLIREQPYNKKPFVHFGLDMAIF